MWEVLFVSLAAVATWFVFAYARIAFHELGRRMKRCNSMHEFTHVLDEHGVNSDVSEEIRDFFQRWMIVRYRLSATDVVSDVVSLEGRELLDDLENMVEQRFRINIRIPSSFIDKTVCELAVFVDSCLREGEPADELDGKRDRKTN